MNGVDRRSGIRRVVLTGLLTVLLLSLVLPAPAAQALLEDRAQDGKPTDETGTRGRVIGTYITSLHDFDPADHSFAADFWLWSVHPPGADPLDNVEFVNAEQVDIRLDQTSGRSEGSWSRQKVRAIVQHDWNLSDFPFDRQQLRIELRLADPNAAAYLPDGAESGYDRNIAPEGWRVADFEVEKRTEKYATTFGDPEASGGSSQHHFLLTLQVERDNAAGFLKMIAGVYAAIALACISFLMVPDPPTIFSGRVTLLAASLFAVVVNLQVSDAMLGSPEELGLIHKIHILAMAFIFAAALLAILSRRGYVSGQAKRAKRRDLIGLYAFGVSFVICNVVLIFAASVSG